MIDLTSIANSSMIILHQQNYGGNNGKFIQ